MTNIQGHSGVKHRDRLRVNAEELLHQGAAPSAGPGSLSVEALELLYRWASNPEFAPDALKLLHELQTHQVELDLLFDQMQSREIELTDELAHARLCYDLAPVPYLVVGSGGLIVESNQAANTLFGLSAERLTERPLNDFLAPTSRTAVKAMFQALGSSESEVSCVAELSGELGAGGRLALKARLGSSAEHILLVLLPDPVRSGS